MRSYYPADCCGHAFIYHPYKRDHDRTRHFLPAHRRRNRGVHRPISKGRPRRRHADGERLPVLRAGLRLESTALLPHLVDAVFARLGIVGFVEHGSSVMDFTPHPQPSDSDDWENDLNFRKYFRA